MATSISLELDFPPTYPTFLHEDNKSAIYIALFGNEKGRKKHMDVRCHLIHDLVKSAVIKIQYQPTESMVADILNNPVDAKLFLHHRRQLLGHLV